jgi:DNA-binding transcriptional ArsR family regulator
MSNRSYVRDLLLADASVVALAETFKVLGDETRVRILDAVSRAELCVCDIASLLGLTDSAVSHQLRLLRGMRLVKPRREGRHIYYTLDDQHIVKLFEQGLEHVQERTPSLTGRADASIRRDAAGAGAAGDAQAAVPAFARDPLQSASVTLDEATSARRRQGRE